LHLISLHSCRKELAHGQAKTILKMKERHMTSFTNYIDAKNILVGFALAIMANTGVLAFVLN